MIHKSFAGYPLKLHPPICKPLLMRLFYFIVFIGVFMGRLNAQKLPGSFRIKNGELSKDKNLIGKKITPISLLPFAFKTGFMYCSSLTGFRRRWTNECLRQKESVF